jgi:amyloid beta precursor protein binding protein 1
VLEPFFFEQFNQIITANLPEDHLLPLADLCYEKNINLVVLRSFGMIGSIRLQVKRHNIIEAKKDQSSFDLRVCDPFPELLHYCEQFDLNLLNSIDHCHVPFVAILFQALQKWKKEVF